MLVDPQFLPIDRDPVLAFMLSRIANGFERTRLAQGVYQIGHFSLDRELDLDSMSKFEKNYPELKPADPDGYFGCYGVCDNWEQIIERCPMIRDDPDRHFVVSVTCMRKADQSPSGGWRWHKWGDYIGTQSPQCEYLYDEPVIEQAYVYHVYQLN